MDWTTEQIKSLTPDASSFAAGQKLGKSGPWANSGQSERAFWGECQGSGKTPYQVRIDVREFAYRCTCPSRKLPCKHVLGLLLLAVNEAAAVPKTDEPEWIVQWLTERDGRTQKKQEKAEADAVKSVDEKVQAKRAAQRQSRVNEGIEQFACWLSDVIRIGIADLDRKPLSFWDDQAKRLVDSQAPALAARLQQVGEIPGSCKDWPQRVLAELGQLALLVEAFRKIDTFDNNFQEEIRQQIGWTVDQKTLPTIGERVDDHWFHLGQSCELTAKVQTQRNWYYGLRSRRMMLFLQFAVGKPGAGYGSAYPELHVPGAVSMGEVVFWPGTSRFRGKFLGRKATNDTDWKSPLLEGATTISGFLYRQAEGLAVQPWGGLIPALLADVVIQPPGESDEPSGWTVRDAENRMLPLAETNHWTLLAVSGGHPVTLFGQWDGRNLSPISVLAEDRFFLLELQST